MRFDKPIGTFLLAAPTLWGIALANEGFPNLRLLAIFLAGIVVMRAAGCIANDLADRNLDGHVNARGCARWSPVHSASKRR